MKKVEVLEIVKNEIRTISAVFEKHCKDEITERQLKVFSDYAKGKLMSGINIWIALEMSYLRDEGRYEESLKRAAEIRSIEEEIEDNIKAMYYKKLEEIENEKPFN